MKEMPAHPTAPRGRPIILAAIMLVLFLSSLDQTIVGTALPRIVTELGGNSVYVWVVTAYLLASTITVPIYGKLSDVFGRKPFLMIGIGLFLLGSALSGQSHNMAELIAFRSIQGLGAGALFPLSLAIIGDLFTPRERGRYQGLFGVVFGVSFIIGPFIGGFLTDNVSWRWIFYVNLPFGLVALGVVWTVLHNVRSISARVRDLDYLGIALFTAGVIPLLIGLTNKGNVDPSTHVTNEWATLSVGGLIVGGLALLVAFLVVEHYAQHPIVPLYLFRDRTLAASNFAVFMVMFGLFSAMVFIPRYYQVVLGVSATQSGYMYWPLLVGLIGSSIGSGFYISKTGKYKRLIISSMVLLTLGGFLMTHIESGTPTLMLWVWFLILGLGVGPSMSAFTVVVQNAAQVKDLGVATSTMTFLRQVGGSIGLALAGTIFNVVLVQQVPVQLAAAGVPQQLITESQSRASGDSNFTGVGSLQNTLNAQFEQRIAAAEKDPPAQRAQEVQALRESQRYIPNIVSGVHNAFSLAIGTLFWLIVGAGLLALFASLLVRELPLRGHEHSGAAESADLIPGAEVAMD